MPPPLPEPEIDDEDYASEEDSDFAPDEEVAGEDGAAAEDADSSDSEADATARTTGTGRKRRQAGDGDADDAGFENSGDEAIIEKGKKRRKKGQQQQQQHAQGSRFDQEEEGGGEGGLIKTRSMRAVECVSSFMRASKKPHCTPHKTRIAHPPRAGKQSAKPTPSRAP